MEFKIYAVAVFHQPTCTHEINFIPAKDDLEALRLGLTDFYGSWHEEAILSEEELGHLLRLDGIIHSIIEEIWQYDLHFSLEEVKVPHELLRKEQVS